MTDDATAEMLLRIAAGDRAAFRELYGMAGPKLSGVLYRILGNRTEVEDALQEVFIRIWRRASQYHPERGAAMSWLIAIARNHALDLVRARPQSRGHFRDEARDEDGRNPLERVADTRAGVETTLVAQGEARRVLDCMDELDPERARAVQGAYIQGLSYNDLAARHGVPLNTMRTWLRRGVQRLKECLDQ